MTRPPQILCGFEPLNISRGTLKVTVSIPWLEYFLNQIVELDPDFTKVYHWAGANVLYGRRFTNENVHRSNRYYELALKRNPDDFEAAYRLGLNHYVELKSDDAEEAQKNREMGLAYLSVRRVRPVPQSASGA